MKSNLLILISAFLLYVTLGIFGACHHELWLDEAHHWLLARDSTSIQNLIYNARYDGHPLVWELILFLASGISQNIVVVQVVHLAIAFTSAFLFLKYSPFKTIQKALIIFGYYFLFEYAVICRSYGLTWLLLILLSILFTRDKRNYLLITIVLFLLANTHLFSLICTIPFFLLLIYERVQENKSMRFSLAYSLLYLAGISISIWQIIPPSDFGFIHLTAHTPWIMKEHLIRSLSLFVKGIIYIPDFGSYHFWNTNYLFTKLKIISGIVSLITLALPFVCFSRKISFFIFYSGSFGIATILYVLPLNGVRYLGYSYMLFLVSLWFDKCYKKSSVTFNTNKYISSVLLWSIFIIQAFSGVMSYYSDYRFPFSESKNVADYIKSNPNFQNFKIVVSPGNSGPPIAAYLKQRLYYPESENWGTFCNWNSCYLANNDSILKKIASALTPASNKNVLLITAYDKSKSDSLQNELTSIIGKNYIIESIKKFDQSIIKEENYTVFQLQNK